MSSESISFPGISNPNPANESFYNQPYSVSFREILHGYNAFYNQLNYFDDTCRDFAQNKPLPVNYVSNTEHKVIKITKQIFSIIIFPIGIYKLVHALVGKVAILPASNLKNVANNTRLNFLPYGEWKYKRITVEVNGYKIDAVIIGKKSTLNNGRWMLASNGNGELYEDQLSHSDDFKEILSKVNSNGIVFNYPGVGASSGQPNRQAMAKAYRAMLCFLEDQDNGVGAKEIIGYGHSIGGGVQGDALKSHSLKKDVKYVFVKSRTFSDLSTIASILTNKPLGFLVKILGWNIDSVESSKKLQVPEIIMQTANVKKYEELKDSSKIIDDGVIPANASLAKALLDNDKCLKANKVFIGIPEGHNYGLHNPSFLAEKIEELLQL